MSSGRSGLNQELSKEHEKEKNELLEAEKEDKWLDIDKTKAFIELSAKKTVNTGI